MFGLDFQTMRKWGMKRQELMAKQDKEASANASHDVLDRKLWKAVFSYYCKYGDPPYTDWVTYAWNMKDANEHVFIRLNLKHSEDAGDVSFTPSSPLWGHIFPDRFKLFR